MLRNWTEVIQTCNLGRGKPMDFVSRWLILTRACVFSMTLTSALIGGLLAAGDGAFAWAPFLLAPVGVLLAHATNNLMNDYFDLESGVDTDEYARALYAPHPVLAGLISREGLRRAILLFNAVNIAIGVILTATRGWPVVLFAGLGLFISVFYVAPPIRLKYRGLGEVGVALVWGPLMIGGTYYVTAGTINLNTLIATLPYALLVTTVLMGKHMDKLDLDKVKGINTLPVILGYKNAARLTQGMMVAFYAIVIVLVAARIVGSWVLLTVLALRTLVRVLAAYNKPKPAEPPPDYPVWPLWFVSLAFVHTRFAGALFVAGLFLNLLVPVALP
ncbi:MAG: hypothetical protein Kow00120_27980 [Anaerolineae bacterium]